MFLLCLFLPLVPFTSAWSADWSRQVDQTIEREIRGIDAELQNFAVWVKYGDQVAQLNADKLFVPASLSKIPTALAFLENFGMDHRFKTWVYHTGQIKQGVLHGDLYLKGGGDPTFVTESLWLLANYLKRTDLKKVTGQLYLDESYFDSDYYSEGRQKRRVDRAYDAPVSALSFNWNAISIYVRPGASAGAPARVYTDPELPMIVVHNRATTTSHNKSTLQVKRTLKDGKIIIDVEGQISQSQEEKAFYKSIGDAATWTGSTFKKLLNQAGIELGGELKKKVTPQNATLLAEHEGWSMLRLMSALSKFSNNFVAEMMTKHLGIKEGVPGNIDDGLEKIMAFLRKKGWPEGSFQFVNPSGLTRQNKLRADLLGELLESARRDFDLAPEFMASLPISGTDGTLKSRMRQTMRGKVRAKTGYLSGVIGLAGYLDTQKTQQPITFVLIYNGPSKNDWEVRAMFNRLLWRIYQQS